MLEGHFFLDGAGTCDESLEDCEKTGSLLHRNNAKLVLLISPDEESLFLVMENTSARGPVVVQAASLQESVSFLEQEVISNQLVLNCRVHAFNRVVCTFEVTCQTLKRFCDLFLKFKAICFGDSRAKVISSDVSCDSNSGALDKHLTGEGNYGAVHAIGGHLRFVLSIFSVAVVFFNNLVH